MRQVMRADSRRGRKKNIPPHHLYTQERNLLEATHRILYLFDQADSGLIPMVLTRQSLYNTLFFLFVSVPLRCVSSFACFVFFASFVLFVTRRRLYCSFSACLEFSLSLLIDTNFLKRRVFWALERFLGGKGGKGGGKDGGWRASFFVIFFFFAFFRYFSEKDRNTQILEKKMKMDLSRFYMVMVMYVLRLGGNHVKYCRLSIYGAIPSFFMLSERGLGR